MKAKDESYGNIKKFNNLLIKIAQKDEVSLKKFYEIFGRFIYATAMTVVKSHSKADEVVDDVLFKIWTLSSQNRKIKNPAGWLYLITINCAKDKIKNEKSYEEIFDVAFSDSRIDEILEEDAFYKDIAELNEVEQQILIYRFVLDLTFEQIAKDIRKSCGYVSTTYYRALEKIKNKLE